MILVPLNTLVCHEPCSELILYHQKLVGHMTEHVTYLYIYIM